MYVSSDQENVSLCVKATSMGKSKVQIPLDSWWAATAGQLSSMQAKIRQAVNRKLCPEISHISYRENRYSEKHKQYADFHII